MKNYLVAMTLLPGLLFGSISSAQAEAGCCPGSAAAAEAASTAQTTCPVMIGTPINRKLYVDHAGKRIYVCCAGCMSAVQADPGKYISQMEKSGIVLDSVK